MMTNTYDFQEGIRLLRQPVLPLIGMVQFLFLTGDFATVDEVINQLPPDIDTAFTTYANPIKTLQPYIDLLQPLVAFKSGQVAQQTVLDVNLQPVDNFTATMALVAQEVLTRELEQINSVLCAPCGCNLCCIGPDQGMQQFFFEIPLRPEEVDQFPLDCIDTPLSRLSRSNDDTALRVQRNEFYHHPAPLLVHWQNGWSLVLPTGSHCPHLEAMSFCRIYPQRPQVCRHPQIFPYVVEASAEGHQILFLRNSLLAVADCPYVRLLHEEISAYGAACELDVIFRQNKA